MIRLLRLILGFVRFSATGGFPERFINLCTVSGITLWEVKNDGVKVEACASIADYKKIRKPAKRAGMKVKAMEKRGFPFLARKHKARIGLVAGAVAAILFILFMSGMLWDVEITGNNTVKSEALTESLENCGVFIGARKSKIDEKKVAEELLEEYSSLTWASVNIYGTRAVLEVREVTEKPLVADKNAPANIVARKDGQIVLIECYSGENAVKQKDTVCKGDLLISGVVKNRDETEKTVRASGKVFAKTLTELTSFQNFSFEADSITESETSYYLYLFGIKIPLGLKNKGDCNYSGISLIKSGDNEIPVGITWRNYFNTEKRNATLTEKEASYLAALSGAENIRKSFAGSDIKSIAYSLQADNSGVTVLSIISCVENIAVEAPLEVEKIEEN